MSATMAKQGGRVHLEQSNMSHALDMANIAKEGFSRAGLEEMQQLLIIPRAEVREEKKQGVVFPKLNMVKDAIERHPAMVRKNQTNGCLTHQNCTGNNPQTHWRRKETGAPP